MASQDPQLHFVMIPLMAQGHQIPMIDFAKLLAERGVLVTIVTTTQNASRFKPIIDQVTKNGFSIRLLQLRFPCEEAGLPQGCENFDNLPIHRDLLKNFLIAINMLQQPLEEHLKELKPSPSCIISDLSLPWTSEIALKLQIPRIVFHGTAFFYILCTYNIIKYNIFEAIKSESEPFVVPGIPDKIELKIAQLPQKFRSSLEMIQEHLKKIKETEETYYGEIVNSFYELEKEYVEDYRKERGCKVWSIGPVSLCNKERMDKVERGEKSSINGDECLKWLDSKEKNSVIYACLGSLCRLPPAQMMEIGLGLMESNHPFIWVIRGSERLPELEKWLLKEEFEERIKGKGLIIRGWAPQVLILSHLAIGGFLTHCGWNSTLEAITASVPMITWPMFADQFINEKFIVEVLKIGIKVGVEIAVRWGEEEKFGVLVKRDRVKKALEEVMSKREEGEERRKRSREFGEMAKRAMEEGGSSHLNITLLIQDIMHEVSGRKLFTQSKG